MQDAVEEPLASGKRGPRPQPASARGGALGRAGWDIDRLRVLPGTFWRGWLVVVLGRSAQFVEPFLPVLLLVELRATSELVAGVLVAAQLAATVGVAAAGPLLDRWGPVRVLRVALVGSAVTCAALAATPGPVVAVPAAIGFGVASAIWRAAAQVVEGVVAKHRDHGHRPRRRHWRKIRTRVTTVQHRICQLLCGVAG